MRSDAETPFGDIESAQSYLKLLSEAIAESKQGVQADLTAYTDPRRVEALQLVLYNLEKLIFHVKVSRRLLNDLRSMRRLLLHETRGGKELVVSPKAGVPESCLPSLSEELL